MDQSKARNATPPLSDDPEEYCECSYCGTIYRITDYPKKCPSCRKRRTYKDIVYPHNPFEEENS